MFGFNPLWFGFADKLVEKGVVEDQDSLAALGLVEKDGIDVSPFPFDCLMEDDQRLRRLKEVGICSDNFGTPSADYAALGSFNILSTDPAFADLILSIEQSLVFPRYPQDRALKGGLVSLIFFRYIVNQSSKYPTKMFCAIGSKTFKRLEHSFCQIFIRLFPSVPHEWVEEWFGSDSFKKKFNYVSEDEDYRVIAQGDYPQGVRLEQLKDHLATRLYWKLTKQPIDRQRFDFKSIFEKLELFENRSHHYAIARLREHPVALRIESRNISVANSSKLTKMKPLKLPSLELVFVREGADGKLSTKRSFIGTNSAWMIDVTDKVVSDGNQPWQLRIGCGSFDRQGGREPLLAQGLIGLITNVVCYSGPEIDSWLDKMAKGCRTNQVGLEREMVLNLFSDYEFRGKITRRYKRIWENENKSASKPDFDSNSFYLFCLVQYALKKFKLTSSNSIVSFLFRFSQSLLNYSADAGYRISDDEIAQVWIWAEEAAFIRASEIDAIHTELKTAIIDVKIPFEVLSSYLVALNWIHHQDYLSHDEQKPVFRKHNLHLPIALDRALDKLGGSRLSASQVNCLRQIYVRWVSAQTKVYVSSPLIDSLKELGISTALLSRSCEKLKNHSNQFLRYLGLQLGLVCSQSTTHHQFLHEIVYAANEAPSQSYFVKSIESLVERAQNPTHQVLFAKIFDSIKMHKRIDIADWIKFLAESKEVSYLNVAVAFLDHVIQQNEELKTNQAFFYLFLPLSELNFPMALRLFAGMIKKKQLTKKTTFNCLLNIFHLLKQKKIQSNLFKQHIGPIVKIIAQLLGEGLPLEIKTKQQAAMFIYLLETIRNDTGHRKFMRSFIFQALQGMCNFDQAIEKSWSHLLRQLWLEEADFSLSCASHQTLVKIAIEHKKLVGINQESDQSLSAFRSNLASCFIAKIKDFQPVLEDQSGSRNEIELILQDIMNDLDQLNITVENRNNYYEFICLRLKKILGQSRLNEAFVWLKTTFEYAPAGYSVRLSEFLNQFLIRLIASSKNMPIEANFLISFEEFFSQSRYFDLIAENKKSIVYLTQYIRGAIQDLSSIMIESPFMKESSYRLESLGNLVASVEPYTNDNLRVAFYEMLLDLLQQNPISPTVVKFVKEHRDVMIDIFSREKAFKVLCNFYSYLNNVQLLRSDDYRLVWDCLHHFQSQKELNVSIVSNLIDLLPEAYIIDQINEMPVEKFTSFSKAFALNLSIDSPLPFLKIVIACFERECDEQERIVSLEVIKSEWKKYDSLLRYFDHFKNDEQLYLIFTKMNFDAHDVLDDLKAIWQRMEERIRQKTNLEQKVFLYVSSLSQKLSPINDKELPAEALEIDFSEPSMSQIDYLEQLILVRKVENYSNWMGVFTAVLYLNEIQTVSQDRLIAAFELFWKTFQGDSEVLLINTTHQAWAKAIRCMRLLNVSGLEPLFYSLCESLSVSTLPENAIVNRPLLNFLKGPVNEIQKWEIYSETLSGVIESQVHQEVNVQFLELIKFTSDYLFGLLLDPIGQEIEALTIRHEWNEQPVVRYMQDLCNVKLQIIDLLPSSEMDKIFQKTKLVGLQLRIINHNKLPITPYLASVALDLVKRFDQQKDYSGINQDDQLREEQSRLDIATIGLIINMVQSGEIKPIQTQVLDKLIHFSRAHKEACLIYVKKLIHSDVRISNSSFKEIFKKLFVPSFFEVSIIDIGLVNTEIEKGKAIEKAQLIVKTFNSRLKEIDESMEFLKKALSNFDFTDREQGILLSALIFEKMKVAYYYALLLDSVDNNLTENDRKSHGIGSSEEVLSSCVSDYEFKPQLFTFLPFYIKQQISWNKIGSWITSDSMKTIVADLAIDFINTYFLCREKSRFEIKFVLDVIKAIIRIYPPKKRDQNIYNCKGLTTTYKTVESTKISKLLKVMNEKKLFDHYQKELYQFIHYIGSSKELVDTVAPRLKVYDSEKQTILTNIISEMITSQYESEDPYLDYLDAAFEKLKLVIDMPAFFKDAKLIKKASFDLIDSCEAFYKKLGGFDFITMLSRLTRYFHLSNETKKSNLMDVFKFKQRCLDTCIKILKKIQLNSFEDPLLKAHYVFLALEILKELSYFGAYKTQKEWKSYFGKLEELMPYVLENEYEIEPNEITKLSSTFQSITGRFSSEFVHLIFVRYREFDSLPNAVQKEMIKSQKIIFKKWIRLNLEKIKRATFPAEKSPSSLITTGNIEKTLISQSLEVSVLERDSKVLGRGGEARGLSALANSFMGNLINCRFDDINEFIKGEFRALIKTGSIKTQLNSFLNDSVLMCEWQIVKIIHSLENIEKNPVKFLTNFKLAAAKVLELNLTGPMLTHFEECFRLLCVRITNEISELDKPKQDIIDEIFYSFERGLEGNKWQSYSYEIFSQLLKTSHINSTLVLRIEIFLIAIKNRESPQCIYDDLKNIMLRIEDRINRFRDIDLAERLLALCQRHIDQPWVIHFLIDWKDVISRIKNKNKSDDSWIKEHEEEYNILYGEKVTSEDEERRKSQIFKEALHEFGFNSGPVYLFDPRTQNYIPSSTNMIQALADIQVLKSRESR